MDKELLIKNNLIIENKQRFYYMSLDKRMFDLEKTTPREASLADGFKCEESSWVHLLLDIANHLQDTYPKNQEELNDFRVDWSKDKKIFCEVKDSANWHQMDNGIWLNCNHTSNHFCWLIQDLLNFYNIDGSKSLLIYHRMPWAESDDVKEAVIAEFKSEFKSFLKSEYSFTTEKVEKIIKNIDFINSKLKVLNTGYDNVYLIDNLLTFQSMKPRYVDGLSKTSFGSNIKNIDLLKRYLDYLEEFYKFNGYCYPYDRKSSSKKKIVKKNKFSFIEEYFAKQTQDVIKMTYAEYEELFGLKLPPSAYKYSSYWDPNGHSFPQHFINGGYEPCPDLDKQIIYFIKIQGDDDNG